MPNHVHLIMTPSDLQGLALALSRAHRLYSGFVNARARRTGHVFQGRYGSVAMDEAHLIAAARYVALNPVAAGLSLFSVLAPRRENRAALKLGQNVGLRPNDPALPIELLSGGNQQKVVVGRWLHLGAKVYIFEDPTAGVDVGAKAEIYRLFDVALQAGAAILIVSTDFEEVAKVCHRALVFDRGRVVAELAAADLSVENLLAAASASIGHSAEAAAAVFIEQARGVHAVH